MAKKTFVEYQGLEFGALHYKGTVSNKPDSSGTHTPGDCYRVLSDNTIYAWLETSLGSNNWDWRPISISVQVVDGQISFTDFNNISHNITPNSGKLKITDGVNNIETGFDANSLNDVTGITFSGSQGVTVTVSDSNPSGHAQVSIAGPSLTIHAAKQDTNSADKILVSKIVSGSTDYEWKTVVQIADNDTSSNNNTWSCNKLNSTIGDIDSALASIIGS